MDPKVTSADIAAVLKAGDIDPTPFQLDVLAATVTAFAPQFGSLYEGRAMLPIEPPMQAFIPGRQ